jgi:hypothetical protein
MTIERCDLRGIVFDELVADDAHVHIERMSNSHIWMAVESAGKRIVLNFSVHKRSLNVTIANEPPAYSEKETPAVPCIWRAGCDKKANCQEAGCCLGVRSNRGEPG